jgi:hypothetical protein
MGRVKNALISEHEQKMLDLDKQYSLNFDDSDAPSSSWELEFNDWLDRYEQSFGIRGDLS